MALAYFVLLIFSIADTSLVDKSKAQIEYYINNIESGTEVSLNSWALYEAARANCETLTFARSKLTKLPDYSEYYGSISCSNTQKSNGVNNSLEFLNRDEINLYLEISSKSESVDSYQLSSNQYLTHYLLLMGNNYKVHYQKEYLEKVLQSWIEQYDDLKNTDNVKSSVIISNIIRAAYILDKYEILIARYSSFIEQDFLPISDHKLKLLGALEYAFYLYGQYDKPLELQRSYTIPLAEFLGNHRETLSTKNRQAIYLLQLGKYHEAKSIFEELYTNPDFDNSYLLFNNLGITYLKLGNTNKYIDFQLRALKNEVTNYNSLLKIYRNLFLYYSSIQDLGSARNYIEKARELASSNSDTLEIALIDSYIGTFHWKNYNNADTAFKYLDHAANLFSPNSEYKNYVSVLFEKGKIQSKIDSLKLSESTFLKIKDHALSNSNSIDYLDALINLTSIYLKQQKLTKADKMLSEIKLHSINNLDFPSTAKYFTVLAKYLQLTGQEKLAIQKLEPVIHQIIERSKNNTDSQAGYWSVEEEYLDAFELMIELYMDNGRQREALSLLDQFKTINDASLYNNPLIKASKLSEEELAEEKKLNQKLQQLRKDFLNADPDKRFALNAEIDRTSAAREQILAKSHLAKTQKLPPMWTIQRSIASNELLLHFTEIGQNLYVGYLTDDAVQIKKFSFDAPVQKLFEQVGDELASGATNLVHLHQLYKILELDDISGHIQQLTVIPDNALYRIPLEVIPVQTPNSAFSFGSARYMIEDYRFRYFTSLHEYATNRRSFHRKLNTDFSGFAISNFSSFHSSNLPSLPFATVETKNIAAELSSLSDKNIYEGNAATKQAFKQNMASSRLLHVATHSEVSDQDPLFSTIYLNNGLKAPDTLQSEQALYAYELFDTPLNSEFVMLNSCSSGSGRYIQGSGIMGISRALRYAGAKSLALNLWSVNDKVAADFATDFYQSLNEGSTKSDAIRKAKLNQLRKANANPHFWGAYMMIGNPAPITGKTAHPWLLYAFLSICTVGLGYLSYKKAA